LLARARRAPLRSSSTSPMASCTCNRCVGRWPATPRCSPDTHLRRSTNSLDGHDQHDPAIRRRCACFDRHSHTPLAPHRAGYEWGGECATLDVVSDRSARPDPRRGLPGPSGPDDGGCQSVTRASVPFSATAASMRTKAILQSVVLRLDQEWFVARWMSTSPAFMSVSPSSIIAQISPSRTMA
jgi:hypothetical protein